MHYRCNPKQTKHWHVISQYAQHSRPVTNIHSNKRLILLPASAQMLKKKVSKLKDKQHLVSSYHNKGQFSCKANATTLEKNKIKTLRGSEMVEKSEVSKLRISTYHLKVCKNTFHLYQYTGYISSAFSFYHICAD